MKTDSEIIDELYKLGPDHAELEDQILSYKDVCHKLQNSGAQYEKLVTELNNIAIGKSMDGIREAINRVRFSNRETGLLMLEASRKLARMAAKSLSISEKMAAIISSEGN